MATKKKNVSFEEELARLESIAEAMEAPNASLQVLSAYYKQGMQLANELKKKLEAINGELKIITEDDEGNPVVEDTDIMDEE